MLHPPADQRLALPGNTTVERLAPCTHPVVISRYVLQITRQILSYRITLRVLCPLELISTAEQVAGRS